MNKVGRGLQVQRRALIVWIPCNVIKEIPGWIVGMKGYLASTLWTSNNEEDLTQPLCLRIFYQHYCWLVIVKENNQKVSGLPQKLLYNKI